MVNYFSLTCLLKPQERYRIAKHAYNRFLAILTMEITYFKMVFCLYMSKPWVKVRRTNVPRPYLYKTLEHF